MMLEYFNAEVMLKLSKTKLSPLPYINLTAVFPIIKFLNLNILLPHYSATVDLIFARAQLAKLDESLALLVVSDLQCIRTCSKVK